MRDLYSESNSRYIFAGKSGKPLTDLKRGWAAVKNSAGIENCRLHDLRHTFASILASAGHSLTVIGGLLGHTQPQTTARYAHLLDDPLREASDTVGNLVMNFELDEDH